MSGREAIDVNEIRQPAILLNGLRGADRAYVMYYDETNNIRRLHVRADGLNQKNPQCFVVGGIAHAGAVRAVDLTGLRSLLRLQPSTGEMKFKHVAKGEFLEVLMDGRIETLLRWVLDEGFFIHFSVLDPLYWSIVDVVDSILFEHGERELVGLAMPLKSDLHKLLRCDREATVDLFRRYTYPDVGRQRRKAFIAELIDRLESRRHLFGQFNATMLRHVLKIALKLGSLPFLENETPNVLIDGFGPIFVQRICVLKNCTHVLDVEPVIRDYLSGIEFRDGADVMTNFRFAVSHDEPGIQVSDVVVGLLGKMFSFICATEMNAIGEARRGLDQQQQRSVALLGALLDRSIAENEVFAHYVMSAEDLNKAAMFVEG